MSQQGGWGGPPQQGGYGPQGGPQGLGQPQQPGYPPQGAYGQQAPNYGPPQPGYAPPGGYAPQGGYPQSQAPQAGGFHPGGFPPQAPPPAKGGSSAKIIGIVVGALVVLGLIGALISVVLKPKAVTDPGTTVATPTVTVATPTRPASTAPATTAPATSAPATTATKAASTAPTTATKPPAGQAVLVGQGISVTPQAGWTVVKQEADFVVLSKGNAVFLAETGKVSAGTTGSQLVDTYLASQGKQMTNVKKGTTSPVDVGNPGLSVAKSVQTGTVTGSGGSQAMAFGAIASVRTSDGVAFVGTLAWPAAEDVTAYNNEYAAMVASMLATQLK